MHVADNSMPDETAEKNAGKILEKAAVAASSTDIELTGLLRYDSDVVNGIAGVIREQKITDLILGIHERAVSPTVFSAIHRRAFSAAAMSRPLSTSLFSHLQRSGEPLSSYLKGLNLRSVLYSGCRRSLTS